MKFPRKTEVVELTIGEWTDALRSGEYAQGKDALRIKDDGGFKHCCLGVLCDLLDPDAWRGVLWNRMNITVPPWVETQLDKAINPNKKDEDGIDLSAYPGVINMNDTGRTFTEIADRIEQDYDRSTIITWEKN